MNQLSEFVLLNQVKVTTFAAEQKIATFRFTNQTTNHETSDLAI